VTEVDRTRPLLIGYIRKHFLMTPSELEHFKKELVTFARREGFTLQAIFVEEVETAPAAFQSLMEAVGRLEVTAVVVPSLVHLSALSTPTSMKEHLEHYTGARVMVASSSP
jgi:hypothetical protein